MRKTIIALVLVAVMLLSITYVYAQGPGFGSGRRGTPSQASWCQGKWSSLTPEQNTKFQELRRKFEEETAPLRGTMLTKALELRSLWTNPKSDSKTILDKEKELRDLQNQLREKGIQYILEARKSLTPEQIAEFGSGWKMGRGVGPGPMKGQGPGMGWGGMSPGYGPCH
jgi:Spy/CpxP family protein refolding chaperone